MAVDQKTKKNILILTILGGICGVAFAVVKDLKANKGSEEGDMPVAPQLPVSSGTSLPPKTTTTAPKTNPAGSSVTVPSATRYAITLKDTMMYKTLKPGIFSLYNSLDDELGEMPKGYYIGKVLEVEASESGYVKLSRSIGGKTYVFYILKNDFYWGGANVKFILPTDKHTLPTATLTKDFTSNWLQY